MDDGNCISALGPGKKTETNRSLHFLFSRGGTQGGEGACFNDGANSPMTESGGDVWFIENVLEELDNDRETLPSAALATRV